MHCARGTTTSSSQITLLVHIGHILIITDPTLRSQLCRVELRLFRAVFTKLPGAWWLQVMQAGAGAASVLVVQDPPGQAARPLFARDLTS